MNQLQQTMFFSTCLHKIFLLLTVTAFLFSCEETADLTRTFVVQQGEHYASPRLIQSLQSNTLNFKATFDESAIYHFEEAGFQDSKNKLLGFSDCNSLHHENSARFAWQWYKEKLEIYAYCYVDGARVEKFIGQISINQENRYQLKVTSNYYVFTLNDQESVYVSRGTTCDKGIYYMLWPYFGGTLPAPHDVSVAIEIEY